MTQPGSNHHWWTLSRARLGLCPASWPRRLRAYASYACLDRTGQCHHSLIPYGLYAQEHAQEDLQKMDCHYPWMSHMRMLYKDLYTGESHILMSALLDQGKTLG